MRRITTALVLGLLLSACAATPAPAPAPAKAESPTPTAVETTAPTCVDSAAVGEARDGAVKHLTAAVRAIDSYDVQEVATQLRLAAADARTMADIFRPVEPGIADHLMRAADDMDKGAAAAERSNITSATSWFTVAADEIEAALADDATTPYC